MSKIKVADWARAEGISPRTALRWIDQGIFPHRIEKTPTGRYFVVVDKREAERELMQSVIARLRRATRQIKAR